MTTSNRPPRLTDRKRAAILQAAVAEFRAFGFAGTSMDRIAATADVSKRTVYNHFSSKDELFVAILLQLWEASRALEGVAYDPVRPLRDQLLAFLAQKLRLLADPGFIDLSRVAIAVLRRLVIGSGRVRAAGQQANGHGSQYRDQEEETGQATLHRGLPWKVHRRVYFQFPESKLNGVK